MSPSRRSECGREALTEVQEALPEVGEGSRGLRGGLVWFGRPLRRSGKCLESLAEVRVETGGPRAYLGGVGRPSLWFGRSRVALLKFREWSGGPHRGPGGHPGGSRGVGWPS